MDEIKNMENRQGATTGNTTLLIALGWVFAIISLFIYPFIFGVLGVIMGVMASKNGSRAAVLLIVASIAFMGIGLIFSGVILNYTRHYLGF